MAKPRETSPDPEDGPRDEDADDKLIREAKKRFRLCADWESTARQYFIEDVKFCNGDSRNMWQWPENARTARGYGTGDERPCLTTNKTAQHVLQIINDGRQNKTSVKIKPVGNGATYEAAQIIEGIVRHIEYISNAQAVYTNASTFQVQGGIGYCRVVTDYVDDESFDQEIYIRPIDDPLSVYLDPDHSEADGSDARFGFVFADVARDEFEVQYPDFDLPAKGSTAVALGNAENAWIGTDKVRVAEYYYRSEVPDRLIILTDPETGEKRPIKASEVKGFSGALREAYEDQLADPSTKARNIVGHKVEWVKIAGDRIVDRKEWAGDTIPIAFAIGVRTVIDGELDRKGHVRALLDPQRMYNYNASASVEYGALQGKTPYLAPAKAIEGLETYWGRGNLDNLAVLPWNHVDDDGRPIPAPEKPPPPTGAPLYQQGMANAAQDMMLVSGQYQPMMGEPSNERSGKAIQARQRQGENSTYHFIDNQALMIRRIGKIIVDLVPKIYDTPRTIKIMGDDGSESDVRLDPEAAAAYEKRRAQTAEAAEQVVMNPTIGRYDVMSDVGPDFATRRQEAFNALSQIAAQNPELMAIIGDLVMLAADFPLADEAAERLKRMVPAQALGEGLPPQVAQLQQQLQSTQALMASMAQKLTELQSRATRGDEQKDIDVYKAITQRTLGLLKLTTVPAADIADMQHQLAMQEHAGNIALVSDTNAANLASDANDTSQAA